MVGLNEKVTQSATGIYGSGSALGAESFMAAGALT